MKRDMDLARKILLHLEEECDPAGEGLLPEPVHTAITEYSQREIFYHMRLLSDANLIKLEDGSDYGCDVAFATRLTWKGHEFLELSRNESVWNKAKKKTKGVESFSFELLMRVLLRLLESQMGGSFKE